MWLLESQTLKEMRAVSAKGIVPTAEQQQQITALFGQNQDGGLRILSKAGRTARVSVSGVLTSSPNWFAVIFGGGNTLYPEIQAAIAQAEQDDSIDDIELYIDSPGGNVAGLFETVAAIQSAKKPIRAKVGNQAASAGYILAAVAEEVVATSRASSVGSFGVAVDMVFYSDEELVSITNSESPDKRPDMKTEEGRAVVREHLDALYDLFADSVATARGVSVQKMNSDFGRGAMFLADEAVKRGMVDRIEGSRPNLAVVPSNRTATLGGDEPEAMNMDLKTLKAQHPDVFAAAVAEGVTKERDRVAAHLTMGEASGDMETALKAVNDGAEMTSSLQAKYMAAGMRRADITARDKESGEAAAAAAAAAGASAPEAAGKADAVAAAVERALGVGV